MIYTVRSGDTLAEIARRFGVTVDTLARINEIENVDQLFVGQEIFIPDEVEPIDEPEPRPLVAQYSIRRVNNLLLILFANKNNYQVGETVVLYLVKINIGDSPVTLYYPTTQRFDFTARTNGQEWTWSRDRAFGFREANVVIEPDECEVYRANWDQQADDGTQMTGNIDITGWNVTDTLRERRLNISININ